MGNLRTILSSMKNYRSIGTGYSLIHKGKEYIDDKWLGGYERKGFGDMRFLTQINLELWRDEEEPYDFRMKVLDSAYNSTLKGLELTNELITFPMVASMVFGNSPEEWE